MLQCKYYLINSNLKYQELAVKSLFVEDLEWFYDNSTHFPGIVDTKTGLTIDILSIRIVIMVLIFLHVQLSIGPVISMCWISCLIPICPPGNIGHSTS